MLGLADLLSQTYAEHAIDPGGLSRPHPGDRTMEGGGVHVRPGIKILRLKNKTRGGGGCLLLFLDGGRGQRLRRDRNSLRSCKIILEEFCSTTSILHIGYRLGPAAIDGRYAGLARLCNTPSRGINVK